PGKDDCQQRENHRAHVRALSARSCVGEGARHGQQARGIEQKEGTQGKEQNREGAEHGDVIMQRKRGRKCDPFLHPVTQLGYGTRIRTTSPSQPSGVRRSTDSVAMLPLPIVLIAWRNSETVRVAWPLTLRMMSGYPE